MHDPQNNDCAENDNSHMNDTDSSESGLCFIMLLYKFIYIIFHLYIDLELDKFEVHSFETTDGGELID